MPETKQGPAAAYAGRFLTPHFHLLPEFCAEMEKHCYGGATGRPREMNAYLTLPDGRRFWLGDISVAQYSSGDGLITDATFDIVAEEFVEDAIFDEDADEPQGALSPAEGGDHA